jgi:hypothetical protein
MSTKEIFKKFTTSNMRSFVRCGFFGLMTAAVILTGSPKAALATLGVSPPTVYPDPLVKESVYKQDIHIMRDDPADEVVLEVHFGGADGRFLVGNPEMVLPAGSGDSKYEIGIAPKDAAVGEYSARIDFVPKKIETLNTGGSGMVIRRGVTVLVRFKVTGEQKLSYIIRDIELMPFEEEQNPQLRFRVQNTGNVEFKLSKITVTIYNAASLDRNPADIVQTVTIPEEQLDVSFPGQENIFLKNLEVALKRGAYIGEVNFIYNDKTVQTTELKFNVLPTGSLKTFGDFTSLRTDKKVYLPGEPIKIFGNFKNSGQVPFRAKMITEIHAENKDLVDLATSEEIAYPTGSERELVATSNIKTPGKYHLISNIQYGNKVSPILTTDIEITGSEFSVVIWITIAFILLLLAILIAMLVRRILRNNKSTPKLPSLPGIPTASDAQSTDRTMPS